MIPKKKNNFLIIVLLLSGIVNAQQFHYTAALDSIGKDGFYSIPISADLSSYLKTDLSDVRIADEKGQWIPHILNWPRKNLIVANVLFDLPIGTTENSKKATIIIIINQGKKNIDNLFIGLKNSAANRRGILSGSDDKHSWFTITDSFTLTPEIINKKPVVKILFPVVNYNYIKLTITNGNNDPYDILKAMTDAPAVARDMLDNKRLITNTGFHFSQEDTAGFSMIRIENRNKIHFNEIKLVVSSPRFYNRRAKLFSTYTGESLPSLFYSSSIKEYVLSSNNTGEYETPLMNDSISYLLIQNGDNPPLKIDTVATLQSAKELVAYLEHGKQYRLLFNDLSAVAPDYDLQKFKEKIPDSMETIKIGNITPVPKTQRINKQPEKNYWRYWMWPVMFVVLLVLGYFTYSLTRDIKKQDRRE